MIIDRCLRGGLLIGFVGLIVTALANTKNADALLIGLDSWRVPGW
jgi:hypothetical protein